MYRYLLLIRLRIVYAIPKFYTRKLLVRQSCNLLGNLTRFSGYHGLSQSGLYNRDSALLPVHARISRPRAAK